MKEISYKQVSKGDKEELKKAKFFFSRNSSIHISINVNYSKDISFLEEYPQYLLGSTGLDYIILYVRIINKVQNSIFLRIFERCLSHHFSSSRLT